MKTTQHTNEFYLSEQEIIDLCNQYSHLDNPRMIVDAVNACFPQRSNAAKVRFINNVFLSHGFCQCDVSGLKMLASHMQKVCTRLLNEARYSDYTYSLSMNGKVRILINFLETNSHNSKPLDNVH